MVCLSCVYLPTMFQEEEISALFALPIDVWEDCQLHTVIEYMRNSARLSLPTCWPADF